MDDRCQEVHGSPSGLFLDLFLSSWKTCVWHEEQKRLSRDVESTSVIRPCLPGESLGVLLARVSEHPESPLGVPRQRSGCVDYDEFVIYKQAVSPCGPGAERVLVGRR